ncbi:MAG: hypothetical protein ACE5KE_06695, partial [Methanosarcinales archaeon]
MDHNNILFEKVLESKPYDALVALDKVWIDNPDSLKIIESLHPIPLYYIDQKYPTIHAPKAYEYLTRLLTRLPKELHFPFVKRFVQYLSLISKCNWDFTNSKPSGTHNATPDPWAGYISSLKQRKGNSAFYSALRFVEEKSLEDFFKICLQIACNDVGQIIGHYFSCSESVVRYGLKVGMPDAKNHIFLLTQYLMQSSPIIIDHYETPSLEFEQLLSNCIKKRSFVGYHYIILANGLIKNKEVVGLEYYTNALAGLQKSISGLQDILTTEIITKIIGDQKPNTPDLLENLKLSMENGDKAKSFAALRAYLKEFGATNDLMNAIITAYPKINDHPQDPHYLTFPLSAFELVPLLGEVD